MTGKGRKKPKCLTIELWNSDTLRNDVDIYLHRSMRKCSPYVKRNFKKKYVITFL
jgi:hypothetical protein